MKRLIQPFALLVIIAFTLLACQAVTFVPLEATRVPITLTATRTFPVASPSPSPVSVAQPLVVPDLVNSQDVLIQLYERSSPGVVSIQVLTEQGGGLGSGFVIDNEGHIITNLHVVEGMTDLEVDFPSGYKVRAEVIGTDNDSDIAVLKVEAPEEELHPLTLGDSDQLKVGQTVVAIGNPYGLSGTMTSGVVSALGRTLDSLHEAPGGGIFAAGDIIQTDAAINPGNSGGPLLNLSGEVIGVNRAIRLNPENGQLANSGIGFAISINIVKRVTPSLIENGAYDYPYLGITSLPELSLLRQEALGLPVAIGAYVTTVTPGGPADEAGLRGASKPTSLPNLLGGGDLILAIDGHRILTFDDMISYLFKHNSPGDTITLAVLRDGREMEVELTLGKRP